MSDRSESDYSASVELESDSFDRDLVPITLLKDNYDLDMALAMSRSLDNKESNILDPEEVEKLYEFQLLMLLNKL
ncbi:uncharacterized protein VNE69_04074 [Vairimorpha necatrix]|uniref:Uncharacterized protein n=1 Tax=Vairimorpha necatrix TaxID=6039 RepID=A0AAX4JBB9_9MICR